MTCILINFEISKKLPRLTDEALTLSLTLLPYLNQLTDYKFIEREFDAIAARFAHTLVQFYID